jgi:YidC/Oxa1 family membrane protein insertase
MIDRKIFLYILIGVISFALWEAWQKDYSQTSETDTNIVNAAVPQTPSSIPVPKIAKKQEVTTIPAARLVTVRTDVLDVTIDTLGGNIIRANLLEYPEVIYQPKPIQLLNDDPTRYYVTESGLISNLGPDTNDRQAQYTSSQKAYTLDPTKDSLKIKLVLDHRGLVTFVKVFTFTTGKYDIKVDYEIDNKSSHSWTGQYYAQIKRKNFDSSRSWFSSNTYTGAAISSVEIPYEKISFSDVEDTTKNRKEFIRDSQGGWVAMQQRYFLSVWVPPHDETHRFFSNFSDGVYTIGLSDNTITVPSGQKSTVGSILYVGPEITDNIAHLAPGLDRTVDYGWLYILSVGFFWILKNIYKLVGNWGLAIILVTFLIKVLFYKLSESSCRSMAKMRDLMPRIQALKERYGEDRQKLHQATMELYKQEKINPLNLGGCLPMLIQIPFFLALYYVLISAVELRHAPFIFWINDLSARDPYHILPILMGLSQLLQQRLSPTSADPTQAKMMMCMPVIFTVFFLSFPSGLVLYWLVSNILSILQQWYINKKLARS